MSSPVQISLTVYEVTATSGLRYNYLIEDGLHSDQLDETVALLAKRALRHAGLAESLTRVKCDIGFDLSTEQIELLYEEIHPVTVQQGKKL